ncbi:GNAT family N-acetyltransferase, partial [Phytoactinopolyspora endophytica]|uniref:GNAT family N-acetyltransferase n=1 Tax=Phytoactinopolyspora endophytica TaxID=1642495 RepID=UPI0013EC8623
MIRHARAGDLKYLQEVERAAGAPFRDVGMDMIADDEPPSVHDLATFQRADRAWVYVDESDRPVAYLLVEVVDEHAHIEQVSVHPSHARRGIGRSLIDVADGWARERGLAGLTLTTYAQVPWNAPYYERLGFRVLAEEDLTDGLRAIRKEESTRGLDTWPRVTMARPVDERAVR